MGDTISTTNTVFRADSLRLGKLPARYDPRTLRLSKAFDRDLPPIPDVYDFDVAHPGVDTPMYLNDQIGDCVIAGRAHWTRRAELIEQGVVIPVSDDDVRAEYFKETGGADVGLNMLDSIRAWRDGWLVGAQKYTIDVFGAVTPTLADHVRTTIFLLGGVYCGLSLPLSAQAQFDAGDVWEVPGWWGRLTKDATPGSWGGHCVTIVAYNLVGPVCITWGKRQQMTWGWFTTYCDECYGLVDSLNSWIDKPGINVPLLEKYLNEVTK